MRKTIYYYVQDQTGERREFSVNTLKGESDIEKFFKAEGISYEKTEERK